MATDLEVEEDSVTRRALASRPTPQNAARRAVFSQSVTREMGLREWRFNACDAVPDSDVAADDAAARSTGRAPGFADCAI